jgi:hypothetical protein
MAKKADKDNSAIVEEAQKRFNRCETWESTARARWLDDIKFCNADAYNMWQWPQAVLENRGMGTGDERPNLTVNKTRQHCLQVINDARQNKSSIKIIATGDRATKEAADVMEGLVRHIEYISNAQAAYGTAIRHQVQAGLGFTRVVTDFAGPKTLDQEIFIRRVNDPMAVYLDPDAQEADASDSRFAFIFERIPKDLFDLKYPKYKDAATQTALNNSDFSWDLEDHVMVAEYYRKVETDPDKIVYVKDPHDRRGGPGPAERGSRRAQALCGRRPGQAKGDRQPQDRVAQDRRLNRRRRAPVARQIHPDCAVGWRDYRH